MFLLDTDTLINLSRGHVNSLKKLLECTDHEVAISSMVDYEFRIGLNILTPGTKQHTAGLRLLERLRVYQFDSSAARTSALIQSNLRKRGRTIGLMDSLIAGHCLSLGKVLVTSNVREFQRVDGLSYVNWASQ